MFLCCVESLSRFRSSLDFLRVFKVTPKSDTYTCTLQQCTHHSVTTDSMIEVILARRNRNHHNLKLKEQYNEQQWRHKEDRL